MLLLSDQTALAVGVYDRVELLGLAVPHLDRPQA